MTRDAASQPETPLTPREQYLYGLQLLHAGRPADAADHLAVACAGLPDHEGVRINLARALLAASKHGLALDVATAGLALWPRHAEWHFRRGTALNALRRPNEARKALQTAVALDPSHASSHLNLGNACADLDDLTAAESHIRSALERDPRLVEAHVSLGYLLTSLGRLREAIAACEAAIALQPDCAQAHWNLATAALLGGDFTRGFAEYEWRKRHDRFRHNFVDLPGPVWAGDDPADRTILVHAEQGFGDTIQFARYLPLIAARGGRPVLACEPPLLPLLATLQGVRVVAKQAGLPPYDAWIDQMSLPQVFATRSDCIPLAQGYLRTDPARVARWRYRLPHRRKIGVVWAGNPAHSNDRRRSLPPEAVSRLLALDGGSFVNLQIGPRSGEAGLLDPALLLADFAETAALVATMDLVLTVDTSMAHVAGALQVPCWVMLPCAPDWRWMLGRDDSPWYASVRLFRQPTPGDWSSVIDAIAAALHVGDDSARRPLCPHPARETARDGAEGALPVPMGACT